MRWYWHWATCNVNHSNYRFSSFLNKNWSLLHLKSLSSLVLEFRYFFFEFFNITHSTAENNLMAKSLWHPCLYVQFQDQILQHVKTSIYIEVLLMGKSYYSHQQHMRMTVSFTFNRIGYYKKNIFARIFKNCIKEINASAEPT